MKKQKHKRKQAVAKPFKKIFLQDWGTYGEQMVVAVGVSMDEVIKYLKRLKARKEAIEAVEADAKDMSELMSTSKGFFAKPMNPSCGSILWLKEWDGSWASNDVLTHELFHAVYNTLGKGKAMMEEQEAMAYQQQYLSESIRRVLNA